MLSVVAPEVIENFKSAARRLTGYRRRQFQAEIALQYCDGSARKAEQVFGWYRRTVETGIRELQTGIRCVDNFAARGRKKAEVKTPALKAAIEELAEPHSQADPKFQTPLAFTRITARAVREELLKRPELAGAVPSRQVVGEILNRLGYRLRRVRKTLPEKNSRNRRHLRQRRPAAGSRAKRPIHVENLAGYQGKSADRAVQPRRPRAGKDRAESG